MSRRGLRLGAAPPPLIHIIQNNIDQDVGRVIDTRPLQCQGANLLSNAVPSEALSEVDPANLQRLQILEDVKRHSRVKGELLIATNQSRSPIRSQP
jgi:hypothetical protein